MVSAPSGAGKSTLGGEILKLMPDICYSISYTTRPPRKGEKHGMDYYFISEEEFKRRKDAKELIESACVHGYWYGTPRDPLEQSLKRGSDILLDIDVQGGKQIKKMFPEAVLIFIVPPSLSVLESRLRGRRQDPEETIQRRLEAAQKEIQSSGNYDYVIVNEEITQAVDQLRGIILSERSRMGRNRPSVLSQFQG